ncbi:PREDICTED: uncharacterized protein LOC109166388 isoform X1 [Ipomoea nil]|uniref:uncharacterized protein LOC109166388 isoform X1 n=1 Tax=Ipomoea nil TaxID=35883 RepID=UPI000900BE07|nr:PREDICTED: uncharacterized protein LOC109166388 isoform X1 [Ipomoea nil]
MGRWRAAALTLSRIATKPKPTDPNSPANPPRRFADFASSASAPIFRLLNLKSFSAAPWPSPLYIDEFDCNPVDFAQSPKRKPVVESGKIPIKAYFLSTSIDLKSLQAEHFRNVIPPASRSSNYTVLRFRNFPLSTAIGIGENADCFHHMVVFQYGSAVLFNVDDDEAECYLQTVRRYATGLLREMKKDDYAVKEKPSLIEDMEGRPDYIVLKNLDTDSIRVISSVLGQSIALDYFVSQIDGMVEEFANINREMERTGNFTMDRKKLFQLVGKANSNLADVILKVGLFERSEIAWRDAKYAQILEYLSEEYEVTQRFANLNFKLKFVEHNIHFLQEVLQNRKSDLLEWVIIVLLAIDNIVSVYEILRESTAVPM